MNSQEIFDTVVTHLFTQGVRSTDGTMCLYRGPGGTSCAVGCLIPDSMYVAAMDDGYSFSSLIHSNKFILPDYFKGNYDLLLDIQRFHDNSEDEIVYNEDSKEKLKYIAEVAGLVFDEAKFERFWYAQ